MGRGLDMSSINARSALSGTSQHIKLDLGPGLLSLILVKLQPFPPKPVILIHRLVGM